MRFASKSKSFYVDAGEHSTLLARVISSGDALLVEELRELLSADANGLMEWIKGTDGKGPTGFAHATCGIYPEKRLIRRQTLDPKRTKDESYLGELYTQQFRIDPEKYAVKILNPADGSECDLSKSPPKEVLFCGLPLEEVDNTQDKLLGQGIYPESLELGTLATLGGLVNYLKFKQIKSPLLVLEMGADVTQSYIVSEDGMDISRPIASGVAAMIPVVQKELGLKDQESALKLFYSNTFDFTSMGGNLVKKLMKELQSSLGFYEVQTGQSIGHVLITQLPTNLSWLGSTVSASLGVPLLKMEMQPWLESLQIKIAEGVSPNPPDERWVGLFSLIASYENAVLNEKK